MSKVIWDWSVVEGILPSLWGGLVISVEITILAAIISICLGFFFAIVRISEIPIVSSFTVFCVNFLRGTPFLVQLYFVFYVLPQYGISVGLFTTGIVALGISMSGYMSEVFRASIESIPTTQWEACLALRLPITKVWTTVILPQALRTAIPSLGSYIILMFKETAVLSTIGLSELLSRGMEAGYVSFRFIEPLTLVGVMYLAISLCAAKGLKVLEMRLYA